jgi:hypothetical protein
MVDRESGHEIAVNAIKEIVNCDLLSLFASFGGAEFGLQLVARTRQLRSYRIDKVEGLREIGRALRQFGHW